MSPEQIGLIGIIVLLGIIFIGVHIGVAMALVGFVGLFLISGPISSLKALYFVPFATTSNYNFAVLPLFMLMSEFISAGGIASQAFEAARVWVGRIRGGLALAALGGCALLAATTGSSLACALIMGKVAYPQMKKFNYSSELSSGILAAGGSIGAMIPPSIPFVIIGIMTDTSIGKLFIAGILPGITQTLFYAATVYIICRINPSLGPASSGSTFQEKVISIKLTWPIALLFLVVMGGIYMGICTATEAAAIGAFGALLIGLSRKEMQMPKIFGSLKNAVKLAGVMLFLLVSAMILNKFLALSRIPLITSQLVAGMEINRYVILVIVLLIYIIAGCFFDINAILLLTLPIIFPVITSLGFDPIWYGVLMCRTVEMGFITPPFGLNLFGLNGVIGIPMDTLFKGVIPFVITDLLHLTFLVSVPSIALFLPNAMMG